LPGIQVKINYNNQSNNSKNIIGEICVKGPTIFKGYYNDIINTRKVLQDGWLHTGDLGKIDKNGNVYFCGLKKKMINVGGINVYPLYVERLIKKHPNVEKITIFSEKSEIFGDIPCAIIDLKINSQNHIEEFKQWCKKNINNSILPIKMIFNNTNDNIIKKKIYEHNKF